MPRVPINWLTNLPLVLPEPQPQVGTQVPWRSRFAPFAPVLPNVKIDLWTSKFCGPCQALKRANPQSHTSIPITIRDVNVETAPYNRDENFLPVIILYVNGVQKEFIASGTMADIDALNKKYGN